MDYKRLTSSTFAVFGFVFLLDFIVHGQLLSELYDQTSSLWRDQDEFKVIFMFISQFSFALFISMLCACSKKNHDKCKYATGFVFGLILASLEFGKYCYMPIPFILSVWWSLAAILKGMGSWVLASMIANINK